MIQTSFKTQHPLEKRKEESTKILTKYPGKIPIIVEKNNRTNMPDISKNKFLAPSDLTIGQFLVVIRNRIDITEHEALFLFVNNNILPPTSAMLSQLYNDYKDEDNFLYVTYCSENTFGH